MRRVAVALLLLFVPAERARVSETRPLTGAALEASRTVSAGDARPPADTASLRAIDDAAQRVARRRDAAPGGSAVAALNGVVFDELGFVREVEDQSLEFVLLPAVLRSRRGSCVGLGTLYLALGEALGWKVEGIMRPGHFYVRVYEDGRAHNVELLRRGEEMPDAWYRERWPIPGGSAPEYDVPLTPAQVTAVIEYDIGNARRRAGRLLEARRSYDAARGHFPAFAEAHASSALVSQLLGALDEAGAAYAAAARANPRLPGLEQNVELLERERRERSASAP